MDSPSANKAIAEKTNLQLQPPLKCPRCGSCNTKFCYYNNYSLSQPRHFCRACKRYWTRGGTLRNVPVGGGCRKNKRGNRRRHLDSSAAGVSLAVVTNPTFRQRDLDPTSASGYGNNNNSNDPLFYGLPTNPMELNFPIWKVIDSARVCDHRMNVSGLGFLSSLENGPNAANRNHCDQIQDALATSNTPLFSISGDDTGIFVGSSTTTTMASLLASGIQHQKFITAGFDDIQPGKNLALNAGFIPNPMPHDGIEQVISSCNHSSVVPWNTNNFSAWIDPSSTASSSVPSLT